MFVALLFFCIFLIVYLLYFYSLLLGLDALFW